MPQLPVRQRHPAGGDATVGDMRRGLWRLALLGLIALGWVAQVGAGTGGATNPLAANKTGAVSARVVLDNRTSRRGPFSLFHMNDVHARVLPHRWIVRQHGADPTAFEEVGGAAYLAGELEALASARPTALILDAGDISEGDPVGDTNDASTPHSSNGGMTSFYTLLANKLKRIPGRGGRGIDALVVGNHDVRDASYLRNLESMHGSAGIPVVSVNVRDIATHRPHFAASTTVTVNGTRIGILGYTTPTAVVGAALKRTLEVVRCDWNAAHSGATKVVNPCHLADYVNELRNTEHCDIVILLAHDGHSDLVDPVMPVLADTADAKLPEIAVTGHWHTWAETVWQPAVLNYKTIFTESASYMNYIGELNVDAAGKYLSSVQHVLRDRDITPDPDVATYVNKLVAAYDANATGHKLGEVVGYTGDALMQDERMKWWSANEYPWSGNNTASQWVADAMQWKCARLFSACDLAMAAGGGVRADIPAGPVTWKQVYETFPWADDLYYRVNMTGQDIADFLGKTNLAAGYSRQLEVTAHDGIATRIDFNGQAIDPNHWYTVGIDNHLYDHPPAAYVWRDRAPLTSAARVRESLAEFMTALHPTSAVAYRVGGDRYHFDGHYSGGYRAVVTMLNNGTQSQAHVFIRFLRATPETLARRGSKQVPASLVNADGSIAAGNRLAEQAWYRGFLGFKHGALKPGDIVEIWGKAGFYGGNPEFIDQEGIHADGVEFKIVGHDDSLARPVLLASIDALLKDDNKNHYVQFLAKKSAAAGIVVDQYGQTLKVWDATGHATSILPGNTGDTLRISGVLTLENLAFRLRSDSALLTTASLPAAWPPRGRTPYPLAGPAPVPAREHPVPP